MKFAVGLSGASGSIYFVKLIEFFSRRGDDLYIVSTRQGSEIFKFETGQNLEDFLKRFEKISFFAGDDFSSPLASGTGVRDLSAFIIIPCSMKTVSNISHGSSSNLLERCADVFIKEKKKLLLVPRETPLSLIHLNNLLNLARLGATVLPAMPGFYHKPGSLDELIDHITGKVADNLGLEHTFFVSWGK
ncbi:UbiX family flavin prenyltransferase [Candidatus Riflebacteria bacterium]